MFCDVHHLSGEPFEGDPRNVLRRNLERAREKGFTFYAGARDGVLLLRVARRARAARPRRLLRPHRDGHGVEPAHADDPARSRRWASRVEYSHHELGPSQHEIDLRYTDALTMADNVMTFRIVVKEVAHGPRRVRDVHAQADRRRVRVGDAHAPLAVRGRRQRVPRPRRRVRALEGRARRSSPACCATHARSPRSRTRRSTPTSGSSSATRHRCTSAGRATTAPRSSACRSRSRARRARPASSSARPTPRATRTSRSR